MCLVDVHEESEAMANFRQQLFHEFATKGIITSVEAFQTRYQPKKESRFNVEGITYEIGPARLHEDHIEFEISSKIPQDELEDRDDFESYFGAIKTFLENDPKQPEEIDMDNIVHDVGGDETKERDYVRLRYRYRFEEMYSNEAIAQELAQWQKDPAQRPLPEIPNVNTMAGRVLLLCVEDFMRQESTVRMERLIVANEEVRERFHTKRGAKKKVRS
jgi:hypothetical protein